MSDLDLTMREIVAKITPAVAEILGSREAGKIELHFAPGQFKKARKEVAL